MLSIILLSICAVGASVMILDDDDDAPVEETEDDNEHYVRGGETSTGDEGDDLFLRDPDAENYHDTTINAGDGDDTLSFFDPAMDDSDAPFDDTVSFFGSVIDAGAGDDVIDVVGNSVTIDAGEGDDTVNLHGFSGDGVVYGGTGDDILWGETEGGNAATLDGGAGNDTIDVRLMENVQALGGEGDDLIYLGMPASPGAGYYPVAEGGAGDDTISFEGSGVVEGEAFGATHFGGGEGSDSFQLDLDEGALALEGLEDGLGTEDTLHLSTVNLDDYDPDEDTLEIDATSLNDSFTLTTAHLEEVAVRDGIETHLILRYESDTEANREMMVNLGQADVQMSDITFVGDEVPVLLSA